MDSNASFAGEVERNVCPDNDFSLRGKLHQVRSDPGRLLASLRGRRTCISASSMSGAGGRSQTENLSLTKRLQYRLCCGADGRDTGNRTHDGRFKGPLFCH